MARKVEKKVETASATGSRRKKGLENLKKGSKFTSETARIAGAKGNKSQREKRTVVEIVKDFLQKKMRTPEEVAANALAAGIVLPKETCGAVVAVGSVFANIIANGDYRGLVELAKMGGCHFDQGKDALGGANNPLSVSQSLSLSPDEIKKTVGKIDGLC